MRSLKCVITLMLLCGVAAVWSGEKDAPPPPAEAPKPQTGTISGTVHPVSNESIAKGATAELHVLAPGAAKGEETVYNLFADGSNARKLKDLAKKGASATVSGIVNEKGYQVTSVQEK